MVFWNIVIAVAAFFLNLILMPKPQNAKPASLEDFDIPVAEEGVEIPVAFGTVYIKSPNVMWYGDLRVIPVKGPRRYGFFGPRQTIGYQYLLGMHMILCQGVHDEIQKIWAGDKLIFPSSETSYETAIGNTIILINKLDVFGGEDREGGIYGFVTLLGGVPGQGQDSYLATHLAGDDTPAFRGVVSIIWNQLYIGNNSYIKPWKFRLQRIFNNSRGDDQWYLPKAGIPVETQTDDDVAFYFAIDTSESIVGVRMSATRASLHGAVDYLRAHTDKSYDVRFVSFANVVVDSLEFRDAAGTDFNELDDFIDALTDSAATTTDFSAGASQAATFFAGAGSKTRVVIFISDNADQFGDALTGVAAADATLSGISNVIVNGFRVWGAGPSALTDALESLDNTPADNHTPGTGGDDNPMGAVPRLFSSSTTGLYSALNPSPTATSTYYDMNPAHIIRECLTDHYWGMGYAAADIDDDSFTYAADTLYSEQFGMSLLWTREEKLEEFITVVLSHIDAYLFLKRTTGKFYLKLIRKDYDINTIPVFDEDDVVTWDEIVRRSPAEAVNSVIVKYTDRVTTIGDNASLQVDNLAQIQALGERIGTTRVYPGISRAALASRVASRDQLSLGIGMISGRVRGKRTWDGLYPGDPFRLVSDRHNLEGEVMRVAELKFGDGRDNLITVKFVQDVFNLGVDELVDSSAGEWESPSGTPAAVVPRLVWEAPYRDLAGFLGPSNATTLLVTDADAGVIEVAGVRPTSDSTDALLYVDSTQQDIMTFSPGGLLDLDVGALDTEITLTDDFNLDLIDAGTLAAIIAPDLDVTTAEIVRVDAVVDSVLTISRGFVDTVPQAHAAGDWVVVYGNSQMTDFEPRTESEAPVVELLTRSGLGTLTQALAPDDVVDMDSRAARPLRPADVRVEGEPEGPVNAVGQLTIEVTLAERNRLTEIGSTLLTWNAVTVAPEAGQTIVLEILDPTNTTVLATHAGLDIGDFPYAVPFASFGVNTSGWIRAGAARDGYREWQAYAIETLVGGAGSGVGNASGEGEAAGVGGSGIPAASVAAGTSTVVGVSASLVESVGSAAGMGTVTGASPSLTAMVYSYEGSTVDNANLSTFTFTGKAVGAAGAGRVIALGVNVSVSSIGTPRAITGVTCDGNAMTAGPHQQGSSSGNPTAAWFYIADATGTTKTFVVSTSSSVINCTIHTYRLFPVSSTPVDSAVAGGTTPKTLTDLEVKVDGLALILSATTGNLTTPFGAWTGVNAPTRDVTDLTNDRPNPANAWSIPTSENNASRDFTITASGSVIEAVGISFGATGSGVGSAAGTSAVAGVGRSTKNAAGAAAGTSTVAGTSSAPSGSIGSAAGTGTATAVSGSGIILEPGDDVAAIVSAAAVGDTFYFTAGTYREQTIVPKNNQIFIGADGAILNGSAVLTAWTLTSGKWHIGGQSQQGLVHPTAEFMPGTQRPGYPECVFIDDVPLVPVDSLANVVSGTFYLDYATDTLYIADNPSGHVVEASKKTDAFHGSATGVTISNLIVEKYGPQIQDGAINAGVGWTVEDCETRLNYSVGISMRGNGGSIINCFSHDNGEMGLQGGSFSSGSPASGILVEGCRLARNGFWSFIDPLWEGGGCKFTNTDGLIFRDNDAYDNNGSGLWADINNVDTLYEDNVLSRNTINGISHEISYDAIIRNNTFWGNGFGDARGWGFGVDLNIQTSKNVEAYGNRIEATDGHNPLVMLQQNRGSGPLGTYECTGNYIHDNVVVNHDSTGSVGGFSDYNTAAMTGGGNVWQDNEYHMTDSSSRFEWGGNKTFSQFVTATGETGTRDVSYPDTSGWPVSSGA